MTVNIFEAIAQGLTQELHTPGPDYYRISYRTPDKSDQTNGNWHIELTHRYKGSSTCVLRLILHQDAIYTSNPKTTARIQYDYADPRLIEQLQEQLNHLNTNHQHHLQDLFETIAQF